MLCPEPIKKEVLKVAERYAAIDRATGGERDDERIGASSEALRTFGCIFDCPYATFESCDPCVL
jgi:hypothetical protein